MMTDQTMVIGANAEGEIVFFKSFDYLIEKDDAQSTAKYCQETFPIWLISGLDHWKLVPNEKDDPDYMKENTLIFKIPIP